MDYINGEIETDKQSDAQRCCKCGMVRSDNHLCQMGSGGTSPLPAVTQADIATELKRAEAAAVKACRRVARTFDDALMYEDELPADMPDADYSAWFCASRLVDGVRMGPRYAKRVQPEEPSATA